MKVALIGCGHMGETHIHYILKTKGVQLVALSDQNEFRAREMARQHNTPYYTNLAQMLAETRPDVVHILTPPQTHAKLTIRALEAGCHVLVEKPLCLTPEEADAISAAMQSAGRLVSVDHTHLWSPLVQKAKRVVESGQLGRVLHIHYVMGDNYMELIKGGHARWALELRGGIFCDLIPHPLYLIRTFLPNAQVVSARACGTNIHDLRELWVDFTAKGSGANLWLSLNQRPLEHNLRIYCEGGTVHLDLRNFCLAVVPERGLPSPLARVINTLSESWQRGMGTIGNVFGLLLGLFDPRVGTAGAIRAFYQAIDEGTPSPVSREEARAVVELSTVIWNMLEGTPGAIQPALNEHGQPIVHKAAADFAPSDSSQPARILVTGGTGFIGSHLVRRLVAEGKQVRVLCRESSSLDALPTDGVEIAFGDVSDLDSVRKTMQGIEVLYHLAATMKGDWAAHYQGTVVGTKTVLQAAVEAGIKKVIYVSSLSVLHSARFGNGGTINETFSLEEHPEARGHYSRAKLEAEKVARRFMEEHGLDLTIIRPGIVYGLGRAQFLANAGFLLGNGLALVVGMGGRRLGVIYVDNLIDALLMAERSENSWSKTYHIVDPDQPTVRQYIQSYQRSTGKQLTTLYIPTALWVAGFGLLDGILWLLRGLSPNLTYRLRSVAHGPWFETTAAQQELGWKARVSLKEGMRRTLSVRPDL